MKEFAKTIIFFLLSFSGIVNACYGTEINVGDDRQLKLNESWVIAVTMYTQGWMVDSGSSNPAPVQEEVACVLPLFVNVSGRGNYKGKNWRMAKLEDDECWILSYHLGCTDDSQFFNYAYCGTKKDVYISTKSGMIRRFATNTDNIDTPVVLDGIHYIFNNVIRNLPMQTIPHNDEYKKLAVKTDKDENKYKIEVNRQTNNDGMVLTLILQSPSNVEESRIVQYWRKNSNWWSEYEYWERGNKVLTARLLKHIPADGFCEWNYQNGKKITNAAFVRTDQKTVILKQKDNSKLSVPNKQLSTIDNWHIAFITHNEQNEKREWNMPDGQSKINAKYIFSDGKEVKIESEDGLILTLNVSTLTQKNKDYVNLKIAEQNQVKTNRIKIPPID
jgi:hypothetical protein